MAWAIIDQLQAIVVDDEITRLKQALAEAESRREAAECRREEAETRALEEQRLRKEAEDAAKPLQLLQFGPYLDACHSLGHAIEVVTDPSSTTQGDTTNPAGRICPRRIVPVV
ncbi:hypothetical protein B0T25DRAFT_562517 [Lasiosphaeria hispida]|uniref:Uncharacterized protein n=1 Tax=Lasiosphaeria hispida TaxID=260671 RepID=A0AAJ0HVL1_9PEZI|nr:hypothetical protein B0T25DRAFT_562517 [Lasiosphaeria hispida]